VVRRVIESACTKDEAGVMREVAAPEFRRARGGTVPDTIHRICEARDIPYDFLLK
jgi:hypothetical protein